MLRQAVEFHPASLVNRHAQLANNVTIPRLCFFSSVESLETENVPVDRNSLKITLTADVRRRYLRLLSVRQVMSIFIVNIRWDDDWWLDKYLLMFDVRDGSNRKYGHLSEQNVSDLSKSSIVRSFSYETYSFKWSMKEKNWKSSVLTAVFLRKMNAHRGNSVKEIFLSHW